MSARDVKMVLKRITVLLLFFVSSHAVPRRYVDRDEQQIIDHLLLHSPGLKPQKDPAAHTRDETDELEREKLPLVYQKADETQNSAQYQLIKKAAVAVVKRLSMPSPPKTDSLIDKAVHFVLKKSMPDEYNKIRSGIKELVDKLLVRDEQRSKPELPKRNKVLREDKILTALEDIISQLSIQLKLTTLQTTSIVNISVDVLAKHFGLQPWQNHELHERVSSHVRSKLSNQDLDNKDAQLRKLENKIEMEIQNLKLNTKQIKLLEALMVQLEALKQNLSKEERLRLLKKVIADIKNDLKAEKKEDASPKLTSVNMKVIKTLIREKSSEMQLRKDEIKVLSLAIVEALEKLSIHTSPTTIKHGTKPTKATLKAISTKIPETPIPIKHQSTTEKITESPTIATTTKHGEKESTTEKVLESTKNPHNRDELEEEMLEGTDHPKTHRPQHTSRVTTTSVDKTTLSQEQTSTKEPEHEITVTTKPQEATTPEHEQQADERKIEEDDLDAQLAADEAELEGRETSQVTADAAHIDSKAEIEKKAEELELELENRDLHDKKPKITEKPTVATSHVTKSESPMKTVNKEESKTKPFIMTEKSKPTKAATHSIPSTEELKKKLEEDLLEGRVSVPTTSGRHIESTQHVNRVTIPTSHPKEEVTQPKTEHVTTKNTNFVDELKIVSEKGVHSRRHRVKIMEDEAELEDLKLKKNQKEDDEAALEDALNLVSKHKQDESLEDELNEMLSRKDEREKEKHSLEDELKDLTYG